jgi:hypothetical protein
MEDNDGNAANEYLSGIMATASELQKGVDTSIIKSQPKVSIGVDEIYAGGVPVKKFDPKQYVHAPTENVLPGTIRTNRIGGQTKRLEGKRLY